MLKELILVPRIIITLVLSYVGVLLSFGEDAELFTLVKAAVPVFAMSFAWQYYVLHFALKKLTKAARVKTLIIWLIVSAAIGSIGAYLILDIDWTLPMSELTVSYAWRMTVYLLAAGMFVGGACTRRAYQKHNAI